MVSQVEDGEDRPIAQASRKLTDAEARYPAIQRELLGVEVSGEDRPHAAHVCGPDEGKLSARNAVSLGGTRWKGVLLRVRTVTDVMEQEQIVCEYHVGKTNHRGVTEAVKHLTRRHYWSATPRTVARVISQCEACAEAKYERSPEQAPQMLTPTLETPLDVVEVNVMFWAGQKVLTVIDRLTRFVLGPILTDKTAARVRDGLLTYLGSHGTIERLHRTLAEHLRLLRQDKGLEGAEAIARAVLAYNSSIHVVTGALALELMTAWQAPEGHPPPGVALIEKKLVRYRIKVRDVANGRARFVHMNRECRTVPHGDRRKKNPVRSKSDARN
ncbi:hypothetical protein AAG570_000875 [Ranatra chinensis]|uniref:RNA-directed DNA polymerase n=1 Tax=Ranatra chinensis TaxID=642074 RepID=A0ABD0ZB07_9HEMI